MRGTFALLVTCGFTFTAISAFAVIPSAPEETTAKITDPIPKKQVGIVTSPEVDRRFVKVAPAVDPKIARMATDGFVPRAPANVPPTLNGPTVPGAPGSNMPALPKLDPDTSP